MIITKSESFSREEIEQLKEEFDVYIKTVIDIETKVIDFNSFINIRPNNNNLTNQIQSPEIRSQYQSLTEFFFKEIL